MTTRGAQVAIVQTAVDLEHVRAELAPLLAEIRKGEALIEHGSRILTDRRYQAGVLFAQARKQFPKSGPKAAGWGAFCEALEVSRDTAGRYIEIAEQVAAQPELAERRSWMDLYRELGLAAEPTPRSRFAAGPAANPAQQALLPEEGPASPTATSSPTTSRSSAPVPAAAETVQGSIELRESAPLAAENVTPSPLDPVADRALDAALIAAAGRLTLFRDEGPGLELAGKPLPPGRRAGPGATTIAEDGPAGAAVSSFAASNEVEKEETARSIPASVTDAAPAISAQNIPENIPATAVPPIGGPAQIAESPPITSIALDQAAHAAELDADLADQQEQLARCEQVTSRSPKRCSGDHAPPACGAPSCYRSTAYEVETRIALLRSSPYLRDIPEGDRGVVATKLREMADGLAPDDGPAVLRNIGDVLRSEIGDDLPRDPWEAVQVLVSRYKEDHPLAERAEAAEARVRELEAGPDLAALRRALGLREGPEAERMTMAEIIDMAGEVRGSRDAAEGRVRALMSALSAAERRHLDATERTRAEQASEGEEAAAKRGYQQGREEAQRQVADWLHIEGCPTDECEGDTPDHDCHHDAAGAIEAKIAELREWANGGGAGVAESLSQENARLRMERSQLEQRWEEEGPRRARLAALLSARLTGPEVAVLDAAAQEIEHVRADREALAQRLIELTRLPGDPPPPAVACPPTSPDPVLAAACPRCGAKPGAKCKNYKGQGQAPHRDRIRTVRAVAELSGEAPEQAATDEHPVAQTELTYDRDPEQRPARPAKAKAEKKRPAVPVDAPPLGAEVIAGKGKAARRAVVVHLSPLALVLRAGPGGKPKAEMSARAWSAGDLAPDPTADGHGVIEALKVLRACAVPPRDWIEELERL